MPHIDILGDKLREGDSCFVRAEGDVRNQKPFIAKIYRIEPDEEHGGYQCLVKWFYRPEDPGIPGGRKPFHGERELYKSDHRDTIHSDTILGRCCVHSLEEYNKLELVRPQDYFTRFSWSVQTRKFSPEQVTIYCSCRQPENPDRRMWQCDMCQEWFHAECVGSTPAALDALSYWLCPTCAHKPAAAAQNGWVRAASPAALLPAAGAAGAPGLPFAAGGASAVGPAALGPAAASAAPAGSAAQPLAPDPLLEVLQSHLAGFQQQQQQQQQTLGGWLPATSSGSGSGIFGL